jgi:hypothetical protein
MKAKKAESIALRVIVVLVIAIAFALIYFTWLKDYRTSGENLSDYQICKISNFENAKLKLKIGNYAIQERSGNKCKTEYLEVPKNQELNLIARNLARCWDQYLEGKETLFDTEDNNYCAICSVLTFEDKKELNGLTSYMMKEKVPWQRQNTYYQYLNRIVVKKENLETVENAELLGSIRAINTDVPWAVMFVEGKDINPGSLTGASSIEQATVGTAVGAVAGGVVLVGAGLCATVVGCTIGAVFIGVGAGVLGFFTGSGYKPDVDSRALLWRYTQDDLAKLKCTILEGQEKLDIRK